MIDPAIVERVWILVEIAFILSLVAGSIRLIDLAVAAIGRRNARRRLQRGTRLADRRRCWDEIDELNRNPRSVW